jgi:hypothetical protein
VQEQNPHIWINPVLPLDETFTVVCVNFEASILDYAIG